MTMKTKIIYFLFFFYRMSSKDVVEMSGCGTVEIDVTKMFWKSFTLSPPIESELFSPDIRQRRRTAPPGEYS